MPTFETLPRFERDFKGLDQEQQKRFKAKVKEFVEDLQAGAGFRASLRIKGVQGKDGVYEMTWEYHNGRATWQYGTEQISGQPHVIWRRIGTHDIFEPPPGP